MNRHSRTWLCFIGFLIVAGCGKATAPRNEAGPKNAAETQAESDLTLFGLAYHNFLDSNSRPPRNLDEFKLFASSDQPIDYTRYHIIWGVDLKSITQPRTVLAYDVDAPSKGGMVLFHDGNVERLSAEEFQKLPKAVAAKQAPPMRVTFTPAEYEAEFKKLGGWMGGNEYKNKLVELKGVSNGIETLSGKPELLVASPGKEQEAVRCFMSGEFWAKVAKGQQVTVEGRVPQTQGSPMLTECTITSTGPSTAVTITAEQLAREVTANEEAATAKYKGKSFIMTGEVISFEKHPIGLLVKLKGTDNQSVDCQFPSRVATKEWQKNVAPGAKIKIYAEYNRREELTNCQLITR